MPAGPVIANNTPLVALGSIGQLALLQQLYAEILIPCAVYDEFLAIERPLRQELLQRSPWIKPTPLANPRQALVYVGLDQGEAEVLALASERSARLVIMDERRGRRYAQRLGLPLTGTLGVLLAAREARLITRLQPLINNLLQAGLYVNPELVAKVLLLAGE